VTIAQTHLLVDHHDLSVSPDATMLHPIIEQDDLRTEVIPRLSGQGESISANQDRHRRTPAGDQQRLVADFV